MDPKVKPAQAPAAAAATGAEWNERPSDPRLAMADSGGMFRLLFERSADAIWLFDPKDQVFVDCNDAAVALMRCGTREQLLRLSPAALSPPLQPGGVPSAEAARDIAATTLRQGAHRFEWVARRFDGTDVPLEVIATVIESQGRPVHVVVSRDISKRREAEAALLRSERMLSSIADNITEAVYRTGPDHGLVYVNPAYLRMFRYDRLEDLQRIPRERLYACPEARQRLLGRLAADGRFSEELEFQRQDGTRFWGHISSVAIREPGSGATAFHVGTITDVTDRRAAEEKVRQLNATLERRVEERTFELTGSEARLRTLIEHAPEAIVVLDGESGRFVSCNDNAVRLFGLAREELLQLHPAEVSPLVQPDGRLSLDAAADYITAAAGGRPAVFEWMHRRADGRLIPCEIRLVRLPGEGRSLLRESIIDNSERRRREQVQQATFDILEAVHRSGDLDSLFARIHGIIRRLMPAENFYLSLYDAGSGTISFPYYIEDGALQAVRPRPTGTGLTGYVLRTGRPLLVDRAMNARKRQVGDAVTFEGYEGITYVEAGRPAAIWLGVPLLVDERPIGVMAVQDYHDEKAYGEEEKQILTFVARQTALAIDRKRAQQAAERRADQMLRYRGALLELALLDKSDFRLAIETICARAADCARIARVGYWSLDAGGTALACEALYRMEMGTVDRTSQGQRICAREYPAYFAALGTRQPLAVSRVPDHPATRELAEAYLRPLGITSMLDVPVWLNGRLIGVLCHEHIGPEREWTAEEIDFAASVATMVALAVEAEQRARSEQALRESEQKFRALFEASSQGVMLHDEHSYLEVNPATLRILGYERASDLIGKSPAETSPPFQPGGQSTAELARQHIAECLGNGSAHFDWLARRADGRDVPVEVILTRIPMGGRQIIQAVIHDISERKKAEAELRASEARLRESEARFSAAFHASPIFITIARLSNGRFVEVNDAFVSWLGRERGTILGRTSEDLGLWVNAPDRAAFWEVLQRDGKVRDRECLLKNAQGQEHVALLSGDIVGIQSEPHLLVVGLDITDRKKAEAELLRALGREKELSQLKSNFVSMVSHEFRTPLGIIMSSAEILADYLDRLDAEERGHHLRSIARNSRRMSDMMEEVLVLGRLDAGRMDCQPGPLDLSLFFTRLIEEVRSATEERCPIRLRVTEAPGEAQADDRLLRHIFVNLLTNAVKYSEPGQAIDCLVGREGTDAVCRIVDRGIGIPDADQPRLFNAFHRGKNVGQRPGTGLGLVIVKRCVELHGGRLQLDSVPGNGTTVTVRLPLFSSHEPVGLSPRPESGGPGRPTHPGPQRDQS